MFDSFSSFFFLSLCAGRLLMSKSTDQLPTCSQGEKELRRTAQ